MVMVATGTAMVKGPTGCESNPDSGYDRAMPDDRRAIITAWVQHCIDQWRSETPKPRSYQWIATRIGCSKPNAINIHSFKTGVGANLEASIAERMFNGSHDALYAEALAWWRASGERVYRQRVLTDERLPSDPPELVEAISTAPVAYLPATVEQARMRASTAPRGLPVAQWADYLDGLERENRRLDRALVTARPVADDEPRIDAVPRAVDDIRRSRRTGKGPPSSPRG